MQYPGHTLGRAVLREVFLTGTRLTAAGLGLGTLFALLFAFAVRDLLIGVSPTDARVWGGSLLFFGAVTVAATLGPAWRASRIDPADSLRAP